MGDKNKGLYDKFRVSRVDGSDAPGGKHHGCRYFVLDVDHDRYAATALRSYAQACKSQYPSLAYDLVSLVGTKVDPRDRRIAELEAALGSEKETRVKYQDIVYAVCVRLEQMGAPRPLLITEVTTALAALLAQARREGIDMAINHLEKSDCPIPIDRLPPGQTKRQFSNTVIEFLILELRQMAREVKP